MHDPTWRRLGPRARWLATWLLGLQGCSAPAAGDTGEGAAAIVEGTPDSGDPAVAFLWLGGGTCSGTLISPHVVLTAAHCVEGASPSGTEAFFGTQVDDQGVWIPVTDLAAHPSGDIAAVTLAEAGPATPIPIYSTSLGQADVGRSVRIVGFGVTSEWGSDSGLKREGSSTLYDYDAEFLYIGASGSSTCYGDSGGPAFFDVGGVEHVGGVTSFGTDACGYGLSGETRVDVFSGWVASYIDEHDPATCDADSRCASGCTAPDPDCPCAADGFCTAACGDVTTDPDCAGCAPDGTCRSDCPSLDSDCCAADGGCEAECGSADPDCDAQDDDGENGDGTSGGDGDDGGDSGDERREGDNPGMSGGCSMAPANPARDLSALHLVALVGAIARRRRR